MKSDALRHAVTLLLSEWRNASKEQGRGFWLAIHQPISGDSDEADTPVSEARFVSNNGSVEDRTVEELQRFFRVRNLPGQTQNTFPVNDVGYASLSEVAETNELYIGFQFGPRYGRGARFQLENGKLKCTKELWLS